MVIFGAIHRRNDDMPQMTICFFKLSRKPPTPQGAFWNRDFRTDIQAITDPNISITRYGRDWRLSQPIIINGFWVGKLGFISSGKETRQFYDERKHDFIKQMVDSPNTKFVLWAIDLESHFVAFEIKPPDIKYQSFRGAFEKYLNEHPSSGLEIGDFVETSKFKAWVHELDRITLFKATLRVPNPHWAQHPDRIRDFLEKTNADRAKIELTKSKAIKQSLKTDGTIIEDAVKFGEDGHSDIFARGEIGEQQMIFDSKKSSPSEQVEITKAEVENDNAKWNKIVDTLRKFAARKKES